MLRSNLTRHAFDAVHAAEAACKCHNYQGAAALLWLAADHFYDAGDTRRARRNWSDAAVLAVAVTLYRIAR